MIYILPFGSAAPAFNLPDLAGGRKSLTDLRGKKTLVIFFNPRCGFCRDMAPELAGKLPVVSFLRLLEGSAPKYQEQAKALLLRMGSSISVPTLGPS